MANESVLKTTNIGINVVENGYIISISKESPREESVAGTSGNVPCCPGRYEHKQFIALTWEEASKVIEDNK